MSRLQQAHKATKSALKARIALMGPAGAGKTYTANVLGQIFADGKPILVIDTEHSSASLYADLFEFDTLAWQPPYDPRELAETVLEAGQKYGVVIIDSLSHFWMGEGGTLDVVDSAAARAKGNTYAGWKEGTPTQNDMVESFLRCPAHVIATMRSKTAYVLEDRNGKQVPRRIGMAPVQREGLEFEFTVTAELDIEHNLIIDKTRCHLLAGKMFKGPKAADMAETLKQWLENGEPIADRQVVERMVARMNALPEAQRKTCKAAFVERFVRPEALYARDVAEADALIRRYEQPDTAAEVSAPSGDGTGMAGEEASVPPSGASDPSASGSSTLTEGDETGSGEDGVSAETYDKRRRLLFAWLTEHGIDPDHRHLLIREATGGAKESSSRLTSAEVDALKRLIDQLADGTHEIFLDSKGTHVYRKRIGGGRKQPAKASA